MPRSYAPRMAPDERRDQLLQAALELIAEEGYGGITIEALARRVDVTRPVVYSAFANLDDLLVTLLDKHERATMFHVREAVRDEGDGAGALIRRAMNRFMASIESSPDGWRVILAADDSAAPPEVRRRYRRARANVTEMLADALRESLGDAVVAFDTEILAEVVITLATRGGTLMLEDPERYPLERMQTMAESIAFSVDEIAAARKPVLARRPASGPGS
jgi:AcrR family transcriptional regulator